GKFFVENRTNINYSQLPNDLIHALVATEDARYFEHEGVDSRSLVRVLFKTILLGKKSSGGGSTITQQLLKNMYGRKNFGPLTMLVNKTKEALLAHRLEEVYSKEEILALYLNTVPFGENVYGIEAASRLFFNKKVEALKPEESAVLIGMLKANTYYNPRIYPDHALQRRNVVLNQMHRYGYVSDERLDSLISLPLVLDYDNLESGGPANYFLVRVQKELTEILEQLNAKLGTPWNYKTDGLIVETTLNLDVQNAALKSFESHLTKMQKRLRKQYSSGVSKSQLDQMVLDIIKKNDLNKSKTVYQNVFAWSESYSDSMTVEDSIKLSLTTLQAGFLAVNPNSGEIISYVGGIDFRSQPYDQIRSKRQLASTFKPILYASALEKGMSPCDYLSNTAQVFTDQDNWKVANYDHTEGGEYSLTGALIKSKNIPTVDLLFKVGFDEVDYLWRKLGFKASLPHVPAMALGIADASLNELAIAYSAFANGGDKIELHTINKILAPDGTILYEYEPEVLQAVMEPRTTELMNGILQKAIGQGTGTAVRNTYKVNIPLAGKTGTSQNYGDAWFASYNPNLVMVTRVGASYNSIHFNSGSNGSGGRLALPISAMVWKSVQNSSELSKAYSASFPPLSEFNKNELNCPDFEEDNAIESILGIFSKKNTTIEQSQKKSKPKKSSAKKKKKKKGLFKRK
ncbi:MAG: transglycosylase domain-containing protein, partial [Salibacteraceae bacterium]